MWTKYICLCEAALCQWLVLISCKPLWSGEHQDSSYQNSLVSGLTEGDCQETVLLSHSYSCNKKKWSRDISLSVTKQKRSGQEERGRLMYFQFVRSSLDMRICCRTSSGYLAGRKEIIYFLLKIMIHLTCTRIKHCLCLLTFLSFFIFVNFYLPCDFCPPQHCLFVLILC